MMGVGGGGRRWVGSSCFLNLFYWGWAVLADLHSGRVILVLVFSPYLIHYTLTQKSTESITPGLWP